MTRLRDYQKSRVYKWEDTHVDPLDKSRVEFKNIQAIVDYIWGELGLLFPPKVKAISPQSNYLGYATRLNVKFHENKTTPTWIIIHELAHSLTSTVDGDSDRHGPNFVGVYMKLLDKFIPGANLIMLMTTAKLSKVDFDVSAPYAITT